MARPLRLLTVLALAAPLPVMAQTWPGASVLVAGGSPIGAQARTLTVRDAAPRAFTVIDERPTRVRRPLQIPPGSQPTSLQLKPATDPSDEAETPKVEIRAKEAWLDDQGFRVSPSRVSYKARF